MTNKLYNVLNNLSSKNLILLNSFSVWYKTTMKMLTTKEAGERLGVTVQRIHALIRDGRLPAEKFGRDYLIKESDLKLVENRKPGRPSKQVSKNRTQGKA
jgi:excisionase family DNA binding protein